MRMLFPALDAGSNLPIHAVRLNQAERGRYVERVVVKDVVSVIEDGSCYSFLGSRGLGLLRVGWKLGQYGRLERREKVREPGVTVGAYRLPASRASFAPQPPSPWLARYRSYRETFSVNAIRLSEDGSVIVLRCPAAGLPRQRKAYRGGQLLLVRLAGLVALVSASHFDDGSGFGLAFDAV
jgi:hypothetical protein